MVDIKELPFDPVSIRMRWGRIDATIDRKPGRTTLKPIVAIIRRAIQRMLALIETGETDHATMITDLDAFAAKHDPEVQMDWSRLINIAAALTILGHAQKTCGDDGVLFLGIPGTIHYDSGVRPSITCHPVAHCGTDPRPDDAPNDGCRTGRVDHGKKNQTLSAVDAMTPKAVLL